MHITKKCSTQLQAPIWKIYKARWTTYCKHNIVILNLSNLQQISPWWNMVNIVTISGWAMRWSSPRHQEITLSSRPYFQPWNSKPPQLLPQILANKFDDFLIQCQVHYVGNPFLEKILDNVTLIDSKLLSQFFAWKSVLANLKCVNTYGQCCFSYFYTHGFTTSLIHLPTTLQTSGAPRMLMFKSTKTTSKDYLLQAITLLFTFSKGLLAFLCQSSLPFENIDQGKNISKWLPHRRKKIK